MEKVTIRTVIPVAVFGVACSLSAVEQEKRSLEGLVAAAQAIVAVEILSTDYTATPADGPMVAEAKVLRVMKGPIRKGKHLRFTETAWVGPTYQKGEYRILFLEQATSPEGQRRTEWRILSHLYAKDDYFVEAHAIPGLSLESLEAFLHKSR